ncbi:T-complex-associated testis-expressed protein 1 [Perkinsus olseni]|uniref:T-complex-associated testis-expressed protein 1 n=4 Tax=Perkinsus olseni TaxID=32597 RepID=A0A7J6NSW7_PEROL|nr:T-complex-associated testis-expressed protein 1 [Perkinsus olseni]
MKAPNPVYSSPRAMSSTKGLRFRAMDHARTKPKKLRDYCFDHLASNYLFLTINQGDEPGDNPWAQLSASEMSEVYARLPSDLPILEAIRHVSDEEYWKRRTHEQLLANYTGGPSENASSPGTATLRYLRTLGPATGLGLDENNGAPAKSQGTATAAAVNPLGHGGSWKQAFIETWANREITVLPLDPSPEKIRQLALVLQTTADYIFRLDLDELPSSLDMALLVARLPCLCSLKVTFGRRRKLGMAYDRALFGMKINDATNLSRALRFTQTLHSLSLPHNLIDDELTKILVVGLRSCHVLTDLDLSHNKICDRGARKISSLLSPSEEIRLSRLSLADNNIHANGAMHIGRHLAENDSLQVLSLRLNRCEDNGASHLLQSLMANSTLASLDLSSNDITIHTLPYLTPFLAENNTLATLDLSANPLYTDPAEPTMAKEDAFIRNRPSKRKGKVGNAVAEYITVEGFEDLRVEKQSIIGVFLTCLAEKNSGLQCLHLRSCRLPAILEERITKFVTRRDLLNRGLNVDAYESAAVLIPTEEESEGSGMEKPEKADEVGGISNGENTNDDIG